MEGTQQSFIDRIGKNNNHCTSHICDCTSINWMQWSKMHMISNNSSQQKSWVKRSSAFSSQFLAYFQANSINEPDEGVTCLKQPFYITLRLPFKVLLWNETCTHCLLMPIIKWLMLLFCSVRIPAVLHTYMRKDILNGSEVIIWEKLEFC